MPGPSPKQPSKRRRANVPKSYGGASPTTAPAAPPTSRELGFDAHRLVESMWAALGESAEARFFSTADWERARWEMWYANELLAGGRPIQAAAWQRVQSGLGDLLVSPAMKRRVAVEVKAAGPDPDAVEAIAMTAKYQQKLRVLKPE